MNAIPISIVVKPIDILIIVNPNLNQKESVSGQSMERKKIPNATVRKKVSVTILANNISYMDFNF